MIYYVYLEPDVFPAAEGNGPYAMQLLIGILRGFVQNCCLVDFDDYRLQTALKEQVNALEATYDRKLIKSLLGVLAKRNRFIYCLKPDRSSEYADVVVMIHQAATALIDLALVETTLNTSTAVPPSLQIATLLDYQRTDFESMRSHRATNGCTSKPECILSNEFLNDRFLKALRHARRINICDRLFGPRFGDNYAHTAHQFIKWLRTALANPEDTEIVFHCESPEGHKDKYIETTLKDMATEALPSLRIAIQYYSSDTLSSLPHDRFIMTEQISLSIGRGMDFLDARTGMARDATVSIISADESQAVLNHYAAARSKRVTVCN